MIKNVWKKVIILLLAALITTSAALSFYYISAEAFHECDNNGCPVCKMIEMSGSLTKRVSPAVSVTTAVVVLLLTMVLPSLGRTVSRTAENLITMKVRLNN
ncbi:MAG: hypothetical protein IKF07_00880 [Eubacterium sp.]|nr:hypothetical protein [Eubacterium sp.]